MHAFPSSGVAFGSVPGRPGRPLAWVYAMAEASLGWQMARYLETSDDEWREGYGVATIRTRAPASTAKRLTRPFLSGGAGRYPQAGCRRLQVPGRSLRTLHVASRGRLGGIAMPTPPILQVVQAASSFRTASSARLSALLCKYVESLPQLAGGMKQPGNWSRAGRLAGQVNSRGPEQRDGLRREGRRAGYTIAYYHSLRRPRRKLTVRANSWRPSNHRQGMVIPALPDELVSPVVVLVKEVGRAPSSPRGR